MSLPVAMCSLKTSFPPAKGNQHDFMVKQGLCKKACQFPNQHRYSNMYPFDENLVNLQDQNKYINASWMKVLPWCPDKEFIITMGPMHPLHRSPTNLQRHEFLFCYFSISLETLQDTVLTKNVLF